MDKAIHGDWFHGPDGSSLWRRLQDNLDDLRTRFLPAFREFRQNLGLPADHTLCVVIDQGIYGLETFLECQREPGLCLLTWDQAYRAGDELMPEACVERFTLTRKRNNSRDLIHVRVEAWEVPHPRIPGVGLIVCRMHRAGKEVAEIAMIRIGPTLSVRKVVKRMTRRWLQENDFKYGNVRNELGGLLLTLPDGKHRLEKPMQEVLDLDRKSICVFWWHFFGDEATHEQEEKLNHKRSSATARERCPSGRRDGQGGEMIAFESAMQNGKQLSLIEFWTAFRGKNPRPTNSKSNSSRYANESNPCPRNSVGWPYSSNREKCVATWR